MIQYPKNTHVTLPSVEAGLGSMNILRDPPKSIVTSYKPKVGDTNKITQWIAASDRFEENVSKFARGVDPMVAVSFSNNGSNGGQVRDFGMGQVLSSNLPRLGQSEAYLPYRVMREGAFRPPLIPPQELLPLSRQNRLPTKQQTNFGSDITRKEDELLRCGTDLRQVRQALLKTCAGPTHQFNLESPAQPNYEVKYNINDHQTTSARTNISDVKYGIALNGIPDKQVNRNKRYASVSSKVYNNIQNKSIDEQAYGNQPIFIQDRLSGSMHSNVSGQGKDGFVNGDYQLLRNHPVTSATTNSGYNIDINDRVGSRQVKLLKKISYGGFENQGMKASQADRVEVPVAKHQETVYQRAAANSIERYSPN